MNDEQKQFEDLVDELKELRKEKNADYGNTWKLLGLSGIIYAIVGKSIRLWNLRNKEPENESVEDTLKDIAVYSTMARMLIKNKETDPKL